jgi:hypothetical protein
MVILQRLFIRVKKNSDYPRICIMRDFGHFAVLLRFKSILI